MQTQNEKLNALLSALCGATLLFGGISFASAASVGEQTNKGMSPNEADTSVDSSKSPEHDDVSENRGLSDQVSPEMPGSNHGMAPNEDDADTSVDSSSAPSRAEAEHDSTSDAESNSSDSDGENSNHGMERNDDDMEKSIDSSS